MATATKNATTTDTNQAPCDASKVKVGDLWTRHSAGKIVHIEPDRPGQPGYITLENTAGFQWSISREILEKEFSFADQFESEQKLSRTKVIELLLESPRTAMTVCFEKKLDHKKVAEILAEGKGSTTDRTWLRKVKAAIAGEESVMAGYHSNSFDEHQRLRFTKLGGGNSDSGGGLRLVDPRTVQWLIVNRVKYVVKG